MNENIETGKLPIAVRIYENNKFGKTNGPAKYNRAVFNATVDVIGKSKKYLLDFTPIIDWQNIARSDEQMECIKEVQELIINANAKHDQFLASWVKFLTEARKTTNVMGFGLLDIANMDLTLAVIDEERKIQDCWKLDIRHCKQVFGKNTPQLIATNTRLSN